MKPRIIFHAAVAIALTTGLVAKTAQAEVRSSGSGFVINELGHLVTNNHVISYGVKDGNTGKVYERLCSRLEISGGDYEGDAELIGRDRNNDLAVLKLAANKRVAGKNRNAGQPGSSGDGKWRSLGNELAPRNADGVTKLSARSDYSTSRSGGRQGSFARLSDGGLRPGEPVIAVGFPFSFQLSGEPKVVTGVLASTAGMGHNVAELQHTAPINPGNSGGPLFDASGRVMGVNVSGLARKNQNVNFAIKANITRALLESLDVPYHSARRGQELRTEEIMARATHFTVLILCHI